MLNNRNSLQIEHLLKDEQDNIYTVRHHLPYRRKLQKGPYQAFKFMANALLKKIREIIELNNLYGKGKYPIL